MAKSIKEIFDYDPSTGLLTRKSGRKCGWVQKNGYLMVSHDNKKLLVHRVAWFLHHGVWPKYVIDHVNQQRADNRIENLRDVSASTNMRNQRKIKGYHKLGTKYRAQYSLNNKVYHIGVYETEQEARSAYISATKEK